ncbi:MAG: hypothetical protein ACYTBV_19890 [Planctomycetota bacterium]|jgi:hypothetical protein
MRFAVEEKTVRNSFFSRHKLAIGSAFYAVAAVADIGMTLTGMGGKLELEGNPLMRAVMAYFGLEAGLVLEKTLVGAICFVIAKYGEREIKREAAWIWKVPSTKWTRAWMRRGDRSWIAYTPLYIVAASQLLAAASWAVLKLMV